MIEVQHLTLQYDDECAIHDLNLKIDKGHFVTIVGASGSGKTSLLSILSGIRKPTQGSVTIEGNPVKGPRLKTAYLLQDYGLLPWKRVFDNISFPFKSRGMCIETSPIDTYAQLLGIKDYYNRFPHQLSGGQKQRVALARALCLDADILLMDEAFSALDSLTKESLQDVLLSIHDKQQQTILFVTHNIEEAVYLGSRIIVMAEGMIKEDIMNTTYGNRDSDDYFEMCKKVRRVLHG